MLIFIAFSFRTQLLRAHCNEQSRFSIEGTPFARLVFLLLEIHLYRHGTVFLERQRGCRAGL